MSSWRGRPAALQRQPSSPEPAVETFDLTVPEAGTDYPVVDASVAGSAGCFTLVVSRRAPLNTARTRSRTTP